MPTHDPPLRKGDRLSARRVNAIEQMARGNRLVGGEDVLISHGYSGQTAEMAGPTTFASCNIKTPSAGIGARVDEPDPDDGFAPASAICGVWRRDALGKIVPTGVQIQVFNVTDVEIGGNKVGTAIKVDGYWQIIVESCGGT